MSDVTNQYIVRARHKAEEQYASLISGLSKTLQSKGWEVRQVSFIAAARSLNEEDLRKSLQVFNAQAGVDTIRSRLPMKICDEYADILKRYSRPPKSKLKN
jgi:hypothetical protein